MTQQDSWCSCALFMRYISVFICFLTFATMVNLDTANTFPRCFQHFPGFAGMFGQTRLVVPIQTGRRVIEVRSAHVCTHHRNSGYKGLSYKLGSVLPEAEAEISGNCLSPRSCRHIHLGGVMPRTTPRVVHSYTLQLYGTTNV